MKYQGQQLHVFTGLIPAVCAAFISAAALAVAYYLAAAYLTAQELITRGAGEPPLSTFVAVVLILLISTAVGVRVYQIAREPERPERKPRLGWR